MSRHLRDDAVLSIRVFFIVSGVLAGSNAAANPVPEWIDYGRLLAENDTHIYYATDPDFDTDPCAIQPELIVYGRVPQGGGEPDKQQLVIGCDAIRPNAMVAGDTHVFFVFDAPADPPAVYRIPLLGGAAEFISNTSDLAIGKDADYVYFFDSFTLVRALQADPTQIEPIASIALAGQVNAIETDLDFVYWTESTEGGGGAVRAIAKTGGPVFTAAEADVEQAWDLVVTDTHVYWSELGGRIRRILITGGPIEVLYDNTQPIYAIDVEADTLVFGRGIGQGGTIWRMPANGGATTLMAFDQFSPRPVAISEGFVYWTTGSVKRLPLDAEADGVDYVIDRMEVTQGIQDGFHTVPMSTKKLTYVRVYARELVGPADSLVRAQLYGSRGGAPLPGSPITGISPPVDVDADGALRAEPEQTLIFALPTEWVDDDVSLQAEINPVLNGDQLYENDYSNNLFPPAAPQTFTLVPRGACVVTLSVAAETDMGDEVIYQQNTPDYFEQLERAQSLLPGIFVVEPRSLVLRKSNGQAFDLTQDADRSELMSAVAAQNWSETMFSCGGPLAVYTGLVHNDADTFDPDENGGFNFGGVGNSGLQANWSKMFVGTSHEPFNQPRGAVTLAHEIGHVFGRAHTDCGGPANPGPYPYPPCQLDDAAGEDNHWGFDGVSGLAIHPTDGVAADLMSYNFNRWPSDFTWEAVHDAMGEAAGAAPIARPAGPQIPVVYLRGRIAADGQTVLLRTAFRLLSSALTSRQTELLIASFQLQGADTDYAVELLGAANQLLYQQPILATPLDDEPFDPDLLFDLVMPFNPNTRAVRLVDRRSGDELARRTLTPNRPSVQIVRPAAGEIVDQILTVFWRAFDADGGPLRHVVQYSPDGGQSWEAVAVDTRRRFLQVPTDNLPGTAPGSASLVRVYTSDGVNTRSVTSAPFEVLRKPPVVHILAPANGAVFPQGIAVLSRGAATDAEDGLTQSGRFAWFVDGVSAGDGLWIAIEALAAGFHTIELRVTDADGETTTDSVRIEIE